MKTMLTEIKNGNEIKIGGFTIYQHSDCVEMSVRRTFGGLTGPSEKITCAGLRRIMEWIDSNN